MIQGVGLDVVEIERIQEVMDRHGDRFLDRVFTPAERRYCDRYTGKAYMARLAARFAAKEAVAKALGTGVRGFGWRQIEVTRNELGAPQVVLHGRAQAVARAAGVTSVLVALTHGRKVAAAQALALTEPGPAPDGDRPQNGGVIS